MACELDWNHTRNDPEIQLRIRPLREQWEARGPGMLAFLSRRLPWIELPQRMVVHLIKPGTLGGEEGVSSDRIHLEAFLANPLPQLPEVVRLSWLCTRTAIFESYHDARVAVALILAAIEAAEYVELASLDTATVDAALDHWFRERPSFNASQLLVWWREIDVSACEDKQAWLHMVRKLDPLRP